MLDGIAHDAVLVLAKAARQLQRVALLNDFERRQQVAGFQVSNGAFSKTGEQVYFQTAHDVVSMSGRPLSSKGCVPFQGESPEGICASVGLVDFFLPGMLDRIFSMSQELQLLSTEVPCSLQSESWVISKCG
ncbi:hypothetical protein D3C80_1621030 [compost metagenome]